MQQRRKVDMLANPSWSAPVVKRLSPDDPLVLKALADPEFAAAARRARVTLAS